MKLKYLSAAIATLFAAPSWGQLLPKMPAPSPTPVLVAPKPAPVPVVTAPVLVAPAIAPAVVVAPAQPAAAPISPPALPVAPPPLPKPPAPIMANPSPAKTADRPLLIAPVVAPASAGKAQADITGIKQGGGASGMNTGVGTPNLDLSSRIPGAGGAAASQNSQQTSSTSPSPNTLYNPQEGRPQDGKAVGPGYFKSKGERLMDLAKPGAPQEMSPQSGGGSSLTTPSKGGGEGLLGNVQTTVTSGQGKNTSSRRQQSSSGDDGNSGGGQPDGHRTILGDSPGMEDTGMTREEFTATVGSMLRKEGGTPTGNGEKDAEELGYAQSVGTDGYAATKNMNASERKAYWEKENRRQGGATRTPTPDQVDDSHMPSGPLTVKTAPKSPSEQAAERSRQVKLPGEGQVERERVQAAPGEGVKAGVKQRTDGRINPSREGGDSPPAGGTGGQVVDVRPRGVDGTPKGMPSGGAITGRPLTQPRPGNTPDNPTAAVPSTNDPSTGTGIPPPTN